MYTSEIFYTKFAQSYEKYSSVKDVYLSAVNEFIIQESKESVKLIDFGSGNGLRSKKIADSIKSLKLTLVDNSPGMIALLKKNSEASVIFKDISDAKFKSEDKFDVATCLWNVLGHISTTEKRITTLKNIRESIIQDGVIFIDVNNRYNISEYGLKKVIKNMFRDIFCKEARGDFELKIQMEGKTIKTKVHIFSPFEINMLIKLSGLKIINRCVINYQTGRRCKSIFGGQLIYKLSLL